MDRPGRRDASLTPFMLPFARASDVVLQLETYGKYYDSLGMVTSSQMGKTETLLDVMGQTMDERPAPIMYLGPDRLWIQNEIEPRLDLMLRSTTALSQKVATGKRSTKTRKMVGGVPIALAWAGSAAQTAGMAAKIGMVDECDQMGSHVDRVGDPFALIASRGFSFKDRIRMAISTPRIGNVDITKCDHSGLEFWQKMEAEDVDSPIWRIFQSGTMHHFCWPCPECDQFFVPRFKQLNIDENWSAAEAKRKAFVECPHCGGVIEERHKADLNARGVFVAPGQKVDESGVVTGDPADVTTLSFWVSGLCSPFVEIGDRAAAMVDARASGNQSEIQAVMNTGFGEVFAPGGGDVPEWQEVAEHKLSYRSLEIPKEARLLTLSADVQKRSIYYTIRAWGPLATSWLIEADQLHGLTTHDDVWDQLATIMKRPIDGMMIRRALIDSGFRPGKRDTVPVNRVYKFCRQFRNLAYPSKGRRTQDKPVIISKQDLKKTGQVHKYGLDLVLLDTDATKLWVHERIRWPQDRPGAWYLPADTTDDYCKQIVSEARVKKPTGDPEWVARSRNNHFFDCEAMQAALAIWLRVDLIQPREEDEKNDEQSEAAPPKDERRARKTKLPKKTAPRTTQQASTSKAMPAPPRSGGSERAARRQRIMELATRFR